MNGTLNDLARIMAERGCCHFVKAAKAAGCWAYPAGCRRARATLPDSAVELAPADDGASAHEFRIIGAERIVAIYRHVMPPSQHAGAFERIGLCEFDLSPYDGGLEAWFPIEQIGHQGERHRLYAEVETWRPRGT